MPDDLPRIAIAIGDPAGIGPEVSCKAALDPGVRAICRPLLVGDPEVMVRHAAAAGLTAELNIVSDVAEAACRHGTLDVLAVALPAGTGPAFGINDAAFGRATLASARRAIAAALAREVDAVVAAPHNQTSIAAAKIPFVSVASPSFAGGRVAGVSVGIGNPGGVSVGGSIGGAGGTGVGVGIGGLNPHAGEGGLFGREEIEIIAPAVEDAKAAGLAVSGPFGCDTMFQKKGVDAFVVMLHDQGHIAAKLLAFNQSAAMTIGSPILFSSVAHGSAFDIAGKGIANPAAMIEAITRVAGAHATRAPL